MPNAAQPSYPLSNLRPLLNRRFGFTQITANFLGAAACTSYFTFFDEIRFPLDQASQTLTIVAIMFGVLVVIGSAAHRKWMGKLNQFLDMAAEGREISPKFALEAQQKLLNLPLFSSSISMGTWFLAGGFMGGYDFILYQNAPGSVGRLPQALWVFIGVFLSGVVTASVIFFLTEAIGRRMIPIFFPQGGVTKVPGVFRIHLRTYILMTFFLACFIPMLDMAVLSYNKARMMLISDPAEVLNSMLALIVFILVVDMAVVILLSRMISRSVVDPVQDMKQAMERVENGDLTARATVFANNELGILTDNFNRMTEGLQDRYQIRRSLALAREVQLNLLPEAEPRRKGLDIAGRLIYCDETGGDYYDYLDIGKHNDRRVGIAVGDVSGHGVASALLMSSARAYLRQRIALPGELDQVVNDVNLEIARDVQDSGRFITLFLLVIDRAEKTLRWIRAGHEPAVLYDPALDVFEELKGEGIPLGVKQRYRYRENLRNRFSPGQILLLATDGLWESRNRQDEMFGKNRVRDVIRKSAFAEAAEIRDVLLTALTDFTGDQKPEDDITLVVIKSC